MHIYFSWQAFICLLCAYFLTTVIHELGHFFAGMMIGGTNGTIHFGNGVRVWKITIWRISILFALNISMIFSVPFIIVHGRRTETAKERLLFAAGGPIFSAVALLMFLGSVSHMFENASKILSQGFPYFSSFSSAWALAIVGNLILPLIPWRYRNGIDSDGKQIYKSIIQIVGRIK